MTTLNNRLTSIESAINTINNFADQIPTEDETEAARKEIFFDIEDFQLRVDSLELQISILEEVINRA